MSDADFDAINAQRIAAWEDTFDNQQDVIPARGKYTSMTHPFEHFAPSEEPVFSRIIISRFIRWCWWYVWTRAETDAELYRAATRI